MPILLIATAAVVVAGCGATKTVTVTEPAPTTVAAQHVPAPPLARVVPAGYRTLHVFRERLSGGSVPEAIVTSTGPPTGGLGFHPADLQVLSWDNLAHRWTVVFDAEKVQAQAFGGNGPGYSNVGPGFYLGRIPTSTTPILDPKADVQVGKVAFPSLLRGKRKQLVFSASSGYGGSGIGDTLIVVDVTSTNVGVVYSWNGEGLQDWSISSSQINAHAYYWTPADAHCCPSRRYAFAVRRRNGYLVETADQRPYLGVLVRETGGVGAVSSGLEVLQVDPHSGAAGKLRRGDVIENVLNAAQQNSNGQMPGTSSVFDKLSSLNAGAIAQLEVVRGGARITVPVKLGSLADQNATELMIPSGNYSVNAL